MLYCDYTADFTVLRLESDGDYLTGLKFVGKGCKPLSESADIPLFENVRKWLDIYFTGRQPDFTPAVKLSGTDFQMRVWKRLIEIPFGQTVTYGELAREISRRTNKKPAPQAIGGAVGKNPVGIIVPCHRVIGCDGSLTGFAGGIEVKKRLLELEGAISKQK